MDLVTGQVIPGPTQAVVVTSTQPPPPQPYQSAHPSITTPAPLGETFFSGKKCSKFVRIWPVLIFTMFFFSFFLRSGVGTPYTVTPYSFVHRFHPHLPAFGGPMPPHRVALPPPPSHMQMFHPLFSPHPGHPQHPRNPATASQQPLVPQYYAPPPVTTVNVQAPPGTHHMFTMQQPMPVNVSYYLFILDSLQFCAM